MTKSAGGVIAPGAPSFTGMAHSLNLTDRQITIPERSSSLLSRLRERLHRTRLIHALEPQRRVQPLERRPRILDQ
jgi:hypothetical protein